MIRERHTSLTIRAFSLNTAKLLAIMEADRIKKGEQSTLPLAAIEEGKFYVAKLITLYLDLYIPTQEECKVVQKELKKINSKYRILELNKIDLNILSIIFDKIMPNRFYKELLCRLLQIAIMDTDIAQERRVTLVSFWLDQNVDINYKDSFGNTALYYSIRSGNKEVSEIIYRKKGKTMPDSETFVRISNILITA